jgi:hypothetical protein
MLDVDMAGTNRHALLPIRLAEIDRARRIVRADSGDLEEQSATTLPGHASVSTEDPARHRTVRYADAGSERVVERRPIVEETVVRRRERNADDQRVEPDR